MDGARLANAAAHLGVPIKAFTTDGGVDIVSFGGTKNGLLHGESVIVLNPEAGNGMKHLRKMEMRLASKMRFVSAQLIALLESDLWLRSATHANEMASRLRRSIEAIDGVFASLPPAAADIVRKSFRPYDWDRASGEVRWMCSFNTTDEDVEGLVLAVKNALVAVRARATWRAPEGSEPRRTSSPSTLSASRNNGCKWPVQMNLKSVRGPIDEVLRRFAQRSNGYCEQRINV